MFDVVVTAEAGNFELLHDSGDIVIKFRLRPRGALGEHPHRDDEAEEWQDDSFHRNLRICIKKEVRNVAERLGQSLNM